MSTDKPAEVKKTEEDRRRRRMYDAAKNVRKILDQGKNALRNDEAILQFKGLYRTVEKYYNKFESLYEDLCDHLPDFPDKTETELFAKVENYYFEIQSVYETVIARDAEKAQAAGIAAAASSSQIGNITTTNLDVSSHLPVIQLPKFDGSILKWPAFRDDFVAIVHDDKTLPTIKKFHYLVSSVSGPAANIISGFKREEKNYALAWDALCKAYQNDRLLASSYLNQIVEFKPIMGKPSIDNLKNFISKVVDNVESFKKLGIEDEKDFVLFHLTVRALDPSTREQFELAHKDVAFPKFADLSKFIRERLIALQLAGNLYASSSNFQENKEKPKPIKDGSNKRYSVLVSGTERPNLKKNEAPSCKICSKGTHPVKNCFKFLKGSIEERYQYLKDWKGCLNCLSYSHELPACASKYSCRHCPERHHSLLHREPENNHGTQHKKTLNSSNSATSLCASPALSSVTSSPSTTTILGTAIAEIRDSRGIYQKIRLVVDCGSQHTFMTLACLRRLNLPTKKFQRIISGIGNTPFADAKSQVVCHLRPVNGTVGLETNAVVVKSITTYLPNVTLPPDLFQQYLSFELADPTFWKSAPVDLLLGAELFPSIWTGQVTTLSDTVPRLFSSIFGQIVMGAYNSAKSPATSTSLFTLTNDDMHQELERFWFLEEPTVKVRTHPDDQQCEAHFVNTHSRLPNGQYMVRLPFKHPPPPLEDSSFPATKRFYNLEHKLRKDPDLMTQYHSFIKEYIDLGHAELASSSTRFVIPHHAVVKGEKDNAKLRVVFDGSAKTNNGSLNDYLLAGPKLQNDIRDILLNFRAHKIAFVTDIVKMFRGILIHPEDRVYQHICWRFDQSEPLQVYQLNTVTYGLTSSPYQANRVMHQLSMDERHRFPKAAEILMTDLYVDDWATGAQSVEQALELQEQIIGLMKAGNLSLSKWASNSQDILNAVRSPDNEPVPVFLEETPNLKILGLQWDPKQDCFSYSVSQFTSTYTKRGILSLVARVYDPLGFLSPAIMLMKSFIQEIWKQKLNWDQPLSTSMKDEWDSYMQQFSTLSEIQIPRFIDTTTDYTYQVLAFCDASEKGYCASIYLRITQEETVSVHLLTAKTRLSPLKTISIPRLELMGALLLARLYSSVSDSLLPKLCGQKIDTIFFTDSSVTLGWINTEPCTLQTFVANRVTEIQQSTPSKAWRHIDSCDNPADCGSRGILPEELLHHPLWWHGPDWLLRHPDNWPQSSFNIATELPEVKAKYTSLVTTMDDSPFLKWITRFSDYYQMLRVVAILLRGIHNYQNKNDLPGTGPLRPRHMELSLNCCVRLLQTHHFLNGDHKNHHLIKKMFGNLMPFLDENGVWRVGGRLKNSTLQYDHKHPILLPANSHFVDIMVDYVHHYHAHAGPTLVQSLIQRKFWVPGLRRVIRRRIKRCITCIKHAAESPRPVMADLPAFRVQGKRAFCHVGVDFAGPFMMRESLRRKAQVSKIYLCLFVCMETKALHLEPVTSLSTEAFLASFDRFLSRRGLPENVYSDSGTNFIGAANKLKELYHWFRDKSTQEHIARFATRKEINWHFNPPYAPHFGGLWEAGVRSVKRLMRTSTSDTPMTYEEFATLFARYEAILNSRPLCPLSSDPDDMDYLSPGHFIVGGPLLSYPDHSLLDCKESLLSRWQVVQRCYQEFWRRWHSEYLTTLQKRVKWTSSVPNVKKGDLVLMKLPSQPVMNWPAARVIDVSPGVDGVVRVATIKTAQAEYRRPVVQLIPLLQANATTEDS